jgi:copper resistance protein B
MRRGRFLAKVAVAFAMVSAPAMAQDHSGHSDHVAPHVGHTMPKDKAPPPPPLPSIPMDAMDHSQMDHSQMDHGAMVDKRSAPVTAPTVETPPPPEAGNGPPRAADAIWGADAMRASRRDLQQSHGDFPLTWFQADRAELRLHGGAQGYLWDVQGYTGGPTRRFWFKSEGEGAFGQPIDDAEMQLLYSRAITPFFDLQGGVRQDFAGQDTTYAVIGVQGLAPYMFEVDGAIFMSQRGDITARFEAELDQRITQRLILQPRAEVNLAAQDVPELGIAAGIDSAEIGVRLRYEITREFAPYVGVEQSWRTARSADFAPAAKDDVNQTAFIVGVRFWF